MPNRIAVTAVLTARRHHRDGHRRASPPTLADPPERRSAPMPPSAPWSPSRSTGRRDPRRQPAFDPDTVVALLAFAAAGRPRTPPPSCARHGTRRRTRRRRPSGSSRAGVTAPAVVPSTPPPTTSPHHPSGTADHRRRPRRRAFDCRGSDDGLSEAVKQAREALLRRRLMARRDPPGGREPPARDRAQHQRDVRDRRGARVRRARVARPRPPPSPRPGLDPADRRRPRRGRAPRRRRPPRRPGRPRHRQQPATGAPASGRRPPSRRAPPRRRRATVAAAPAPLRAAAPPHPSPHRHPRRPRADLTPHHAAADHAARHRPATAADHGWQLSVHLDPKTWWYVTRATGFVGWALLAASVLWGLFITNKTLGRSTAARVGARPAPPPRRPRGRVRRRPPRGAAARHLHRLGLAGPVRPDGERWHPIPIAFGIVAFYLLLAVEISSLLGRRVPRVVVAADPLAVVPAVRHRVGPPVRRRHRRRQRRGPMDGRGGVDARRVPHRRPRSSPRRSRGRRRPRIPAAARAGSARTPAQDDASDGRYAAETTAIAT